MAHPFFEKLKRTVIGGATYSAAKAEEAARKAKLHLDIHAEKHKLSTAFQELGEYTFSLIEHDALATLPSKIEAITLLGKIRTIQDRIEALQTQNISSAPHTDEKN